MNNAMPGGTTIADDALAFAARRRTIQAHYMAAGEGRGEALALGLVHSSISGPATLKPARLSLEIDPLQARAQRLRMSVITGVTLATYLNHSAASSIELSLGPHVLTHALMPHCHLMLWVPCGMFFGKPDQKGWWPMGQPKSKKRASCRLLPRKIT